MVLKTLPAEAGTLGTPGFCGGPGLVVAPMESATMTDDERYLFDLNGYIKIEGILSADEVARYNHAIDHQLAAGVAKLIERPPEGTLSDGSSAMEGASRRLDMHGDMLAWERPWCEPFRELIVHPRLKPYLEAILEEGFRVDAGPGYMATDPGAEGHALHGGGVSERHNFSEAYFFKDGHIYSGMVVLEVALADEGPDDGGFALIPASHKANLPCPRRLRLAEAYQEHIRKVPLKAGDAVIFTEIATHGALPWRARHQRRVVLTRFSPGFIAFHSMKQSPVDPEYMADMTDEQRAVLAPPHTRGH